ncbi:MAG: hypothetical protein J0I47_10995 [Sphingomonas sp.]|uniref:hypothetical protein n=1 Tax=Sphingomonas sp. TaxID=28214 RepID=UPI001AC1B68D|nr:hypothetical protein [Sphingomonas sp.]MBN8808738.1 hypothetical protein [Sphingomonas sp.]
MAELLESLNSLTGLGIALGIIAVVALLAYLHHDSFPITDVSYRLPLVGKLARYSRDLSEKKSGGWLNSELTLCRDYARHVSAISPEEFGKNSEYLRKAFDAGRKPIPKTIFGLIGALIVMEAVGFALLLSSWMATDSSENFRWMLTAMIVAVLAIILVMVTHAAGHQLYRTRLLRSCFKRFQAENLVAPETQRANRTYTSRIVSLSDEQGVDDDRPQHVQCANRVATTPDDLGSYAWVWIAGALIVTIATLSTLLRIETLQGNELAQSAGGLFGGGGGNAAAASDSQDAQHYAAITSFWILAIVFVVTQLVGMGVGYRYGFVGKQSGEAYRAIGGCADYETYFRPMRRRMSVVDLRLSTLHRMMERHLPVDIDWDRDFLTFVREERKRGVTDLQDPTEVAKAATRALIEDHNAARRSEPAAGATGEAPPEPTAAPSLEEKA